MPYGKAIPEMYGPYKLKCPECGEIVNTVPAEEVPDQALRGCPECGAVWDINNTD